MIAMLTSCDDDNAITQLAEVQVSSSYIAIPLAGGTTTITVNAKDSWSIDTTGVSSWLTVEPVSGSAGETSVSFTAPANLDGREAELLLSCGGKTQHLNVIQGLPTVSEATCAEVIAGPDSKTYRVTGTVTAIANTTYGNFYLADETGQIYIYGTVNSSGNYAWSTFGIEVGDEVTVQGPKTTYNGVVELVKATFISVNKSLIKVDSTYVGTVATDTIPLGGGSLSAYLTCKGQGVTVDIPTDAADWLSMSSITSSTNAATVVFKAVANTGGDRNTTITFHTTDGTKDYTSQLTIYQKGAIVDATVAEFLAAAEGDTQYRVTGVIDSVARADRGRFFIRDYSGRTYVYNLSDFAASGAKVGDIITLVGKRSSYNSVPQMVSASIEKLVSVSAVSIADFLTKADDTSVYYMVTGAVASIANATYGNLYLSDGTNQLYVYGCYPGYGATGDARKNFLATAGVDVGDTLTVIGTKSSYKGTPQLANGIYFSHVDVQ